MKVRGVKLFEEGFRPGYLLRRDMTGSVVQTQEALPSFACNFVDFSKARRVMTQPYLQIFDTPGRALEWLLAGQDEAVVG